MRGQKTFCCYDALEEIYLFPDQYNELKHLIFDHSDLVIDLNDKALFEKMSEDGCVKTYYRQVGSIDNDEKFFVSLNSSSNLASHTGSIIVADLSESECEKIGKEQGILLIPSKSLSVNYFQPTNPQPWSWVPGEKRQYSCSDGICYDGWGSMLKRVSEKQIISTANIIINDDYIFDNPNVQFIAENIFSIVKGLVSKNILIDVYVLIIGGDSKKYNSRFSVSSTTVSDVLRILNSLSASLKPMNIKYGALTHEIDPQDYSSFHERFIITDYSISSSEHGFLDFEKEIATLKNDLNYFWAYYNLGNPYGSDIPLKKIREKLNEIKKLKDLNVNMRSQSTHYYKGYYNNKLLN